MILYHLGIGAGAGKPTDPKELEYTYEKDLKVLPSYGVIPVFGAVGGMAGVPGIQINFALVLHGEQDIEIHRPIPARAKIETHGRIAGIYDKGKAALIVVEVETKEQGGAPLFTNRFSIFARGEGGFGGESGPKAGNEAPTRAPDAVVESPTVSHQALLYRLSGDKNPLHADPGVREARRLRQADPARAVLVRDRLQGRRRRAARRRRRAQGRALPGALRGRALPRRDDRDVAVARGQADPDQREVQGARRARHLQRSHHAARRDRSTQKWVARYSWSASA